MTALSELLKERVVLELRLLASISRKHTVI